MSNRQLEEHGERRQSEAIAAALGLTMDDLDQLEWRIEETASDDGQIYGHNVYFEEGSDPEILKKLAGQMTGDFIRIGPL